MFFLYITNNERIICYKNRDNYSDSQLLQQGHNREALPNIKITTKEGCNLIRKFMSKDRSMRQFSKL